jgi:hypothetical protein
VPKVIRAIPQALLVRMLARYALNITTWLRREALCVSIAWGAPSVALFREGECLPDHGVCGAIDGRMHALQISYRGIGAFRSVFRLRFSGKLGVGDNRGSKGEVCRRCEEANVGLRGCRDAGARGEEAVKEVVSAGVWR